MSGQTNSSFFNDLPLINNLKETKDLKHKNTNVKVICRIKPLSVFQEPIEMKIDKQNSQISIPQPRQQTTKTFTFNKIYTNELQQQFVQQTCKPILRRALSDKQGYLIFSYGVTNSGKTHTILGSQQQPGILPYLVKKLSEKQKVYLSGIQLYNDEFFSLVNREKLIPKQQNGFLDFEHYPLSQCINQQNMEQKIKQFIQNRTQNDTKLNSKSSRSHAIFRIKAGNVNIGVVDLAGSERTNKVFSCVDQTSNINKSLLCLGKCIKALNENPQSNIPIPYRQSKLTKVLIQYFAAKVEVLMIANINQSQQFYHQNMKVLDYAVLAKDIRHCSTQNSLRKNQFKFTKTSKVDVFQALYKSAVKSAIAHKSLKSSRSKINQNVQKSNIKQKNLNKTFSKALKAQQLKMYIQKFDSSQQTFDYMIEYMHQKQIQDDLKHIQVIKKFQYHSPIPEKAKLQTKQYNQVGVGRSQHSIQLMKRKIQQQMKQELRSLIEQQRLKNMQHKQTSIGLSLMKNTQKQQSVPTTPLKVNQTPKQQSYMMKKSGAIYSSVKKMIAGKVHSLKSIIPNFKKSCIKNERFAICNYSNLYQSLFAVQQLQNSRCSEFSFQNKKKCPSIKLSKEKLQPKMATIQTQTQFIQSNHLEKFTQQTGIQTDDQCEYPSLQINNQQADLKISNNEVYQNSPNKENYQINQVDEKSENSDTKEKGKQMQIEEKSKEHKKRRGKRTMKNKTKLYHPAAERVAQARKIAAKLNRQQSRTPLKRRLRNYSHN